METIKAVVFLSEDNHSQLETIKEAAKLCLPQCLLKAVDNGKELLRILPTAPPPNIIITDWDMPVMNGEDVISTIRKYPEYNSLPIVVFSTEGSNELRRKALQIGATALVQKPTGWNSGEEIGMILVEIVRKYAVADGVVPAITRLFVHDSVPSMASDKTIDQLLAEDW